MKTFLNTTIAIFIQLNIHEKNGEGKFEFLVNLFVNVTIAKLRRKTSESL